MGLNLPNDVTFKWIMSQTTKMFIAREIIRESWPCQISRNFQIVHYSLNLKSDAPYCFADISAPKYHTEKFLYSRQSYGSHLSN